MPVLAKIASRPAVREAASVLVDVVAERIKARRRDAVPPSTGERAVMVDQAATEIAKSPTLVNAINAEPFIQSRVVVGLATAFAGFILGRLDVDGDTRNFILENMPLFIEAVGLSIVGIGRMVRGLKPINWCRPWTIFGIGR